MQQLPKMTCQDFKNLIIQSGYEDLNAEELQSIQHHVQTCASCRAFEKLVTGIQNAPDTENDCEISPDRSIYKHLYHRMKALTTSNQTILRQWWYSVKNLLEHRIPVYQAVSGAIIFFICIFVFQHITPTKYSHGTSSINIAPIDTVLYRSNGTVKDIDSIQTKKIGRSVKEDSALAKFIMTM